MRRFHDLNARRRAQRWGRRSESIAALYLRLKGFRILERSFRRPFGEIDIIARRGKLLCFVEVKARARAEQAFTAITPKQRSRITRTAEAFLQLRPELQRLDIRFDLLIVAPGQLPRHLKGAWY